MNFFAILPAANLAMNLNKSPAIPREGKNFIKKVIHHGIPASGFPK
jgi:hypothetical protein